MQLGNVPLLGREAALEAEPLGSMLVPWLLSLSDGVCVWRIPTVHTDCSSDTCLAEHLGCRRCFLGPLAFGITMSSLCIIWSLFPRILDSLTAYILSRSASIFHTEPHYATFTNAPEVGTMQPTCSDSPAVCPLDRKPLKVHLCGFFWIRWL